LLGWAATTDRDLQTRTFRDALRAVLMANAATVINGPRVATSTISPRTTRSRADQRQPVWSRPRTGVPAIGRLLDVRRDGVGTWLR
jgi:hypothetical protein